MNRARYVLCLATMMASSLLLTLVPSATAHEHIPVADGKYELTLGWLTEPPLADQPNAISLRVVQKAAAKDDGHGHGDHATASSMEKPDVSKHGAIFSSGDIPKGASFKWTADHEYMGLTVPYHCHYHAGAGNTGMAGNVTIDMNATLSGNVTVNMSGMKFSPAHVTVKPGTVITWVNDDMHAHTVTSGLMEAAGHDHDGEAKQETSGHDHSKDTPVLNLTKDLTVKVSIGGKSTTLALRAKHGDPGHYVADIMPTVQGVYTVQIVGNIHDHAVDETRQIQEVVSPATIAFPEKTSTRYDLEQRINALERAPKVDASAAPATAREAPVPGGLVVVALGAAAMGLAVGRISRRK